MESFNRRHRIRLSPWDPGERRLLVWQVLGVFVAISLLLSIAYYQRILLHAEARQEIRRFIYGWDGPAWYAWLLAAPASFLLVRRFPWRREKPLWSLLPAAAGSMLIYFVVTNLRYGFRILPNLWLPAADRLPVSWANYLHTEMVMLPMDSVTCGVIIATSIALDQVLTARRRSEEVLRLKLASAQLQSDLARAQWAALVRQLQPHFLFNALNAVAGLVRQRQNAQAVDMISELSDLLRHSMSKLDEQQISLRQDLAFVRRYLNIEQVRFGEKLQIEYWVDEEALDGLVPNLLLQPLVENAVKHGISRRVSAGRIRLSIRREAGRLHIAISDDGPGFDRQEPLREGIGLSNTRSRLEGLYGRDFSLQMDSSPGGGTTVSIELPWQVRPPEAPAPLAT